MLFDSITFGVNEGDKIGVIAKNGTGKTTLLRLLSGAESPDSGKITYRNDLRVGFLEQNPVFNPELSIVENLISAIPEHDNEEWDRIDKVKQMLSQLGINEHNTRMDHLSGGQIKRVALARVLLSKPDLLILDEPTNHLDISAIEWLENFLSRQRITLLMVTHDRYFLDRICNKIIEIDLLQIFTYEGNFDYYLRKRAERIEALTDELAKVKNTLRKEQEWMRRQPQARAGKARYRINAFYDLNNPIRIIVVVDGEVVCMGSSHGRFSPNAMIIDVNRYLARGPQSVATNTQIFEIASEQNSAQNCDVESNATACTQAAVEEVAAQVEREVEQVVAEEVEEVAEQTMRQGDTPQPAQERKVSPTRTAEPFYKKIEKNLNELFEAHERDEELTLLIPESRWARVPIEGDSYYVVGLIESDGTPNLICYGVPDKDDSNPPKNSSDCRQWMEIEKGGRGYWMMYQSAVSGETLTTTIV